MHILLITTLLIIILQIHTQAQPRFSLDLGGNFTAYQHNQIDLGSMSGQRTFWAESYGGLVQFNYQIPSQWEFSVGANANIVNQPFILRGMPLFLDNEGFPRILSKFSVVDISLSVKKLFFLKKWRFAPYLGASYSFTDPFSISKKQLSGNSFPTVSLPTSFTEMLYTINRITYRNGGNFMGGVNMSYQLADGVSIWLQLGYSIGFRSTFNSLFDAQYVATNGALGVLGRYRMLFSNNGIQSAIGIRFYFIKKTKKV